MTRGRFPQRARLPGLNGGGAAATVPKTGSVSHAADAKYAQLFRRTIKAVYNTRQFTSLQKFRTDEKLARPATKLVDGIHKGREIIHICKLI